jgi:hypothetical protein
MLWKLEITFKSPAFIVVEINTSKLIGVVMVHQLVDILSLIDYIQHLLKENSVNFQHFKYQMVL